jgi:RHS repeat-associated protein
MRHFLPKILFSVAVVLANNINLVFGADQVVVSCYSYSQFKPPSTIPVTDLTYTNSLQGVVNTTPSGALTYQIPIVVPVGTAGMQPQLSIVYSSQNGSSGMLGAGFGLAGLSAISRVGQTFYHDSNRTAVTGNTTDRLVLDGQRLVPTNGNGTYWGNGVVYDTEMASFAKIRTVNYLSNGPQSFQVDARDGNTLFYGYTTNSRTISGWLVDSAVDANGNYISYKYHPRNNGWANQIETIFYTGNNSAGLKPYTRIEFKYINKPNPRTLYVANSVITDGKLLDSLVIYSDDTIVKTYTFHYTSGKTHLEYMREFASCGRIIGELKFDWKEVMHCFEDRTLWISNFGSHAGGWKKDSHIRMLADVTGNGKTDVIGFGNDSVFVGKSSGTEFVDFRSWYHGYTINTGGWDVNQHPRFVKDVNGDGLADIIGFKDGQIMVALSNGNNGFDLFENWTAQGLSFSGIDKKHLYLEDFNGDGLPDIIAFTGSEIRVAINNGSGFGALSVQSFSPGLTNGNARSYVADINGDGRADVATLRRENGERWLNGEQTYYYDGNVALSNGNAIIGTSTVKTEETPDPGLTYINFIDVNGDGKADFVSILDGLGDGVVKLSNGQGFITSSTWNFQVNVSISDSVRSIQMLDMNGDGLPDIVIVTLTGVKVHLNTGNGFSTATHWTAGRFWYDLKDDNFYTFADVNGDGLPDLIAFDSIGVWVSLNRATGYGQLVGVHDNLGQQFTADYDVLTNSDIYTKGTQNLEFPLQNFQGPMWVCTRLETRANTKKYTYEGATIHRKGRGFLGFSKVTETDFTLKLKQVSEFELFKNYAMKLPKKMQVFSIASSKDSLLSENTQTNTIRQIVSGKRNHILPQVTQTTSKDFLTNREQTSKFTYDAHSNVIKNEVSVEQIGSSGFVGATPSNTVVGPPQPPILHNPVNPTKSVTITTNTYTNSAFRDVQNRLKTTKTERYYDTTRLQKIVNEQHFSYDVKGNCTTKIDRPGHVDSIITTYAYNNNLGLVTQIITTAKDVEQKIQNFTYDKKFRFQTSITIPGLGKSRKGFNIWGQIIADTAIGGQITRFEYDEFGRLKRTVSPENFVTTHTITRVRNSAMPNVVYVTEVSQPGRPFVKTYLDNLGRAVRTESPNASGLVIVETKFNKKGQADSVSMPRFAHETPKWTTFKYDDFGRINEEKFENLTTFYEYDGLKTTTIPPAGITQKSSKTYNHTGDLIKATDGDGELIYKYFAPGMVDTIIAPGNAVTTIKYDTFGRQQWIIEPNAGKIEYKYDAFDRIIWQKDANGYVTTNTYDQLGRLRTVWDGSTTTYDYIASGANVGKLSSISTFAGGNISSQTYTYDNFGRISTYTDRIANQDFISRYTYDNNGNLATYTYPSGNVLHYGYDSNGYPTSIHDQFTNTRVWQLTAANALGQELSSTVCGRSKTQQYHPITQQPVRMTMTGLMDYTYVYNHFTGNLHSRQNSFNGTNETFFYDPLNRLSTSSGTGAGSTTYAQNGNITSRSGVGNYTYNPADKPHAVKQVSGTLNPLLDHDIIYNQFGKVHYIANRNNPFSIAFNYGPTRQRNRVNLISGSLNIERFYSQNHERTTAPGLTHIKEYIYSPYGLVATRNIANGILTVNPVATDHLGSIVAEYSPFKYQFEFFGYDAWGRRYRFDRPNIGPVDIFWFDQRLPHPGDLVRVLDCFSRGFTGHEHLDMFGLINMNGRIYDPVLGRMLSPDPYVQAPTFTQSFNRYSYVFNNPLRWIDPTGYKVCTCLGNYLGRVCHCSGGGADPTDWEWGEWYYGGNWDQSWTHLENISFDLGGGGDGSTFWSGVPGSGSSGGGIGPGVGGHHTLWPNDGNTRDGISPQGLQMMTAFYLHFQFGGTKPVQINTDILDFSNVTQRMLGLTEKLNVGQRYPVDLFKTGVNELSLSFGQVTLIYQDNNQFSIVKDKFDFDLHPGGWNKRNIGTFVGGLIFGRYFNQPLSPWFSQPNYWHGGPFYIHFNGMITIRP